MIFREVLRPQGKKLTNSIQNTTNITNDIQWNLVNSTTVRPKYFGRINGVVVLTGVGIKLQDMCFLMTSCNTDYSSVVYTIRKTLYSI